MNLIGPSNLVYLFRKKDNKKVYIFYDVHGLNEKCEKNNYNDILYWLKNQFGKINEIIDLYIETPLFYKEGEYKPEETIEKIRQFNNKCYENFRCHSIDIRNQFININSLFYLSNLYNKNITSFIDNINEISSNEFHILNEYIKNLNNDIISLYKTILDELYYKTKGILKDRILFNDRIKKQFSKLNDYDKDNYIKMNEEFINLLNKFYDINNKFLKSLGTNYFNNNRKKINNNVMKENNNFENNKELPERFNSIEQSINSLINITTLLLDIYTIGRILMPYSKNIIIYVGSQHSKNIVEKLVNYFDFEIIEKYKSIDYPKWNISYNDIETCINMEKFIPLWNI